jgi:hypothetical protein
MIVLTVGVNSWVTVAEADTYFESKFGAGVWSTLTSDVKKQLLITAYTWIQSQTTFSISPSATATKVKVAQCEAAWFIYNNWTSYEKRRTLISSGVKSFDIGNYSEDLSNSDFPKFISDILIDFVARLGGTFPTVNRDID